MRRNRSTAPVALAALAVAAFPVLADEQDDARARLEALHYDLEVAGYCGLVDEAVGAGFREAARTLETIADLTPRALDALRGRAWQAAHAEWQNRGLGGFRAWCRNEAADGARRLAGQHREPPARAVR